MIEFDSISMRENKKIAIVVIILLLGAIGITFILRSVFNTGESGNINKQTLYDFVSGYYQLVDDKNVSDQIGMHVYPLSVYNNIVDVSEEELEDLLTEYYTNKINEQSHSIIPASITIQNPEKGSNRVIVTFDVEHNFSTPQYQAQFFEELNSMEMVILINAEIWKIQSVRTLSTICNSRGEPCMDANSQPGTIDENCTCSDLEVSFRDNDNDGIPEHEDCNDNDSLAGKIGMPCDDNDPQTNNDQIQSDCSCLGTKKRGYTDNDGDGVTSTMDCNDDDATIGKIGDRCDDQNPNTDEDFIAADCTCKGTKSKLEYYFDEDQDGLGDVNVFREYAVGQNPTGWVEKYGDKCPDRKSSEPDGCPASVEITSMQIEINQSKSVGKIEFDVLSGDKIEWATSKGLQVDDASSISPLVTAMEVGKQTLNFKVSSSVDGININETVEVCVKLNGNFFRSFIDPIIKKGQFSIDNLIPLNIRKANDQSIKSLTKLFDEKSKISNGGNMFGADIGSFLISKIGTPGSYVKDIKIRHLKYNEKTCMVDHIDIQILK